MNQSNRIILNTVTTYGCSLVGMTLSLFSARWVLLALGQADYGLLGVVGSIIFIITFLNGGLSIGVIRFYAYSIGSGHSLTEEEAIDDLKRWFNTAFSVHVLLPFVLITIGYPIGVYAIRHWLVIPPDRISACIWVFRISLATAFVNIFSVPFTAFYTAYQHISEFALFGIIGSVISFIGAYFLMGIKSDRLIAAALYLMIISAGLPLLLVFRAFIKYKACRIKTKYLFNYLYFKKLFSYVGWKTLGMSCVSLREQGTPILVNLYFGPSVNAAYSIAQRVSTQATSLSAAMIGSFQPALTSMEGKGERQKVLSMSLQACKLSSLLVLLFVIPLILEMDSVLVLWLKNPPIHVGAMCQWMLAMLVVDKMTAGQMMAVNAFGKIAAYELVQGTILFLALPIMWLFFSFGLGPVSLGYALFITMALYCIGRIMFAKSLLLMPIGSWLRHVAVPVIMVASFSTAAGFVTKQIIPSGLSRIIITSAVCGVILIVLSWWRVLSRAERLYIRDIVAKLIPASSAVL